MASKDTTRVAVFFTHGVSLELWDQRGMLSRELAFYQALAQTGLDVCLYTYGKNDGRYRDLLGPNLTLAEKPCHCPASHYAFMLPFVYWKRLRKADLLRIHQVAGAIPALLAHWLWRKPLIVRAGFHWYRFAKRQGASWLKLKMISLIEWLTYKSATAIIHTTQEDADFVADRYHVPRAKIHVIPNWIDTQMFRPMSVDKNPRSVCFVGRLEEQKNLHALVEAIQGLGAQLIVYGEGSLRESLEQQARDLHVPVKFRGHIANKELPRALNACEIFVLPSLYEGNPKALLEAMACGLPVIGTNVEGIASVLQNHETGLVCEITVDSLKEALTQLLNDHDLQKQIGDRARNDILATSSLEQAVQTELTLYPV
ncbi:glycosyltransferase family 4 protein [Candidatus Uhrbacteria bacterium]|nr:glycosyltransferase family 4 protein [Candidatus Uhrbacteria bacterium]